MKESYSSYSSLFPSYCFRNDDAAVFFVLPEENSISGKLSNNHNPEECSIPIAYEPITGSAELVTVLRRAKAVTSSFGRKIFEELRGKTNYYEGLGKGCFLNRSAMKLVNLDYMFSLIEPSVRIDTSEEHFPSSSPHFSFVDLCGGPGGFIECIMLKCRHEGTVAYRVWVAKYG